MIKIFNNYCATLLIGGFVILATSCQPLFFPNTLAPAKPYSVGKGEVGIRSFNFAPLGADFKVGITNNIQVSGIASPFHSNKETDIYYNYEGSVQINPHPSEKERDFNIFSIGGGVFMSPAIIPKHYDQYGHGNTQTDYIYEGYYPGHKMSDHVSISFPLRLYEFLGHYQYIKMVSFIGPSHTITSTTTSSLVRFQGAAFVPEMDLCFDWSHVALRFGINTPIQFWENYNPITVVAAPTFSGGLYGKW